jgi:hypothetical protein
LTGTIAVVVVVVVVVVVDAVVVLVVAVDVVVGAIGCDVSRSPALTDNDAGVYIQFKPVTCDHHTHAPLA